MLRLYGLQRGGCGQGGTHVCSNTCTTEPGECDAEGCKVSTWKAEYFPNNSLDGEPEEVRTHYNLYIGLLYIGHCPMAALSYAASMMWSV